MPYVNIKITREGATPTQKAALIKGVTDHDIQERLKAKGMHIARRTVSKYREQSGHPAQRAALVRRGSSLLAGTPDAVAVHAGVPASRTSIQPQERVAAVREEYSRLVQASFEHIVLIAAAELFYGRLFELDPSLQQLFHGDMAEQGRKLMHMLTVAVRGLDRPEVLVPAVQALGRRHAAYGVTDAHYGIVGAALLWTLEKGLGDRWTRELGDAWAGMYGELAAMMQQAGTEPGLAAA